MFIERVVQTLEHNKVRYAIAGGYAVTLHGVVRGRHSRHRPVVLSKTNFLAAGKALENIGLSSRLPVKAREVFDFREEYVRNRNLVAWSFVNPQDPSEVIDIIITADLRRMKAQTIQAAGLRTGS